MWSTVTKYVAIIETQKQAAGYAVGYGLFIEAANGSNTTINELDAATFTAYMTVLSTGHAELNDKGHIRVQG